MTKYKKKKNIDPALSAYFSRVGAKGGKKKSPAGREVLRESLAKARAKRWPKKKAK